MDIASPTPAMQRQILPKHIALVLGLVMLATLILVAVVRYSGVDIRYADSPSQQVRSLPSWALITPMSPLSMSAKRSKRTCWLGESA